MISFAARPEFEYGRPDQVSPLIRRVICNNAGPFTFTGTGTYIVGKGVVAVIDPGPESDEHLAAILAAVEGETVSHILTTHTHVDHSPLSARLARATGAQVIGRSAPGGEVSAVKIEEADDARFRPDLEVADGQRICGPGWTLRAIATPGHASNHVCYALEEEQALFSGDHVMGWSTTVISPPDGDMGDYYASLDKVTAEQFTTLWPTHGGPITKVASFLSAYKAHRLFRERQILEQIAQGRGRVADMVPLLYAGVDPRLHPAAARSVLAHLLHLVRTGMVAADGEPGPESVFRRR